MPTNSNSLQKSKAASAGKISPLQHIAELATRFVASSWGTGLAVLILMLWIVSGPLLDSAWDLGDRIMAGITFLLVFLLQRSQTKDTRSIHIKLNELLAALERASPKLINVEDQPEEKVEEIHEEYQNLRHRDSGTHSIDEAHSDSAAT